MAKVNVYFSLKQDDFSQSFHSKGIFKHNILSFYDEDKAYHKVFIYDTYVIYEKQGETSIKFTFEQGKEHVGLYKVHGQKMTFNVKTTAFLKTTHKIAITYDLFQQENRINTVHFTIEFSMIGGGL